MVEILNTNDGQWNKFLDWMPLKGRDVYFTSNHYKIHELNGDGEGRMFVYYDNEGNCALYPFLINKIKGYTLDKEYFDIETAYGYGGPISNCFDSTFIEEFEIEFLNYCQKNNIVAEFIRFHPLLANENMFVKNIDIMYSRNTVFLDLTKGIDKIWNEDIKSKNRNVIRKAKKNGVYIEESNNYEIFKEIYKKTMNKVDADDFYYFEDKYYEGLKENQNCVILNAKRGEKVIASAIFIGYGEYFHYHLSGSLKEELHYCPNNLLIWEAIKYAIYKGYKVMHFGGGLSNSSEDNLYKFKRSFSKDFNKFYIGKRIHNDAVYNYLINSWEGKNNKKANLLLQYRM